MSCLSDIILWSLPSLTPKLLLPPSLTPQLSSPSFPLFNILDHHHPEQQQQQYYHYYRLIFFYQHYHVLFFSIRFLFVDLYFNSCHNHLFPCFLNLNWIPPALSHKYLHRQTKAKNTIERKQRLIACHLMRGSEYSYHWERYINK